MKKLIALTLALMLALTLAACGGDTVPPADSGLTPPLSDNGGGTPLNNNGGNANAGGGGNVAPANIPDNGTPPNAPAPFETHEGDKGYFYTEGDDWAIFMYDVANNPRNRAYNFAPAIQYIVRSFDDADFISTFTKWVFESEANAQNFANSDRNTIRIGNVVYDIPEYPPFFEGFGKDFHIRQQLFGTAVWTFGGYAYLSVPDGFEDLLAKNHMLGKTGAMTVREAFADAGFSDLPPINSAELDFDFDYDMTTNFIMTFNRDHNEATVLVFDGDDPVGGVAVRVAATDFSQPSVRRWGQVTIAKSQYMEYFPAQTRSSGMYCYVGT